MQSLKQYAEEMPEARVIYLVTDDDVQTVALLRLNRKLDEDELRTAKKGIEWGLASGIETIVNTAIEEATS